MTSEFQRHVERIKKRFISEKCQRFLENLSSSSMEIIKHEYKKLNLNYLINESDEEGTITEIFKGGFRKHYPKTYCILPEIDEDVYFISMIYSLLGVEIN